MNLQLYFQTASKMEGDAYARFSLTLQEWPFKNICFAQIIGWV